MPCQTERGQAGNQETVRLSVLATNQGCPLSRLFSQDAGFPKFVSWIAGDGTEFGWRGRLPHLAENERDMGPLMGGQDRSLVTIHG